ncbi:MAG: NAD(P)H-binding protein [Proteobacteria bacterium]|nr:NAD(P)H-binding protein [Pseudomonadota bacterium]
MKNILVIGGTGFTGKRVLALLRPRADLNITVFCRDASRAPEGFKTFVGDLEDAASIATALKGQDGLIYVASLGFGHAPAVVEGCKKAGVRRALFVSTTAIFTKLNAASKKLRTEAERTITNSDLYWTILRPTMIYGRRGDRNMERLVKYLKRWRVLLVPGTANSLQQPVFVDDVAQAVVDAFFSDKTLNKSYTVSGANPHTFAEVVHTAGRLLGKRVWVLSIPLWPCRMILRFYELMARYPRLKEEQLLRLNEDKAFPHEDAAHAFGYKPRDVEAGLKHLIAELQG